MESSVYLLVLDNLASFVSGGLPRVPHLAISLSFAMFFLPDSGPVQRVGKQNPHIVGCRLRRLSHKRNSLVTTYYGRFNSQDTTCTMG